MLSVVCSLPSGLCHTWVCFHWHDLMKYYRGKTCLVLAHTEDETGCQTLIALRSYACADSRDIVIFLLLATDSGVYSTALCWNVIRSIGNLLKLLKKWQEKTSVPSTDNVVVRKRKKMTKIGDAKMWRANKLAWQFSQNETNWKTKTHFSCIGTQKVCKIHSKQPLGR